MIARVLRLSLISFGRCIAGDTRVTNYRRLQEDGKAELKKEIEFETKLRALFAQYGFSLREVMNLLDPQSVRRAGRQPQDVERVESQTWV